MKLGRTTTLVSAVGVLGVAFGSVSCTGRSIDNSAQVRLVITDVKGSAGGETGTASSGYMLSDVIPEFNDNAVLTVAAMPVNPTLTDTDGIAIGTYDNVQLERYDVRFTRTDGHNVEGVDVPFGFSGPLATMVPFNSSAEVTFVIVRHQSKEEPPLKQLAAIGGADSAAPYGGQNIIMTIAEITIHGRTLAGDVVSAQARLEIHFADFGG